MPNKIKYLSNQAKSYLRGFDSFKVNVDGISTSVLMIGSGEPLVVLHGFGGSKSQWRSLALELSGRFKVIVPDIPSFNLNTRVYGQSCSELVAWLHALVGILELQNFHLMSSSMGSTLACKFIESSPGLVNSLCMLGIPGEFSDESYSRQAIDAVDFYCPSTISGVDDLLNFAFYDPPRLPRVVKMRIAKDGQLYKHRSLPTIRSCYRESVDLFSLLVSFELPIVFIIGEADRVTPPDAMRKRLIEIDRVQYYEIPKAGHVSFMEKPADVAAVYRSFIRFIDRPDVSIGGL